MMLTVLFDVLNPCSFFGLAIFFALLFIQDKTKGRLIAGSLFTVIAGIMHYVQQVHTSIFFAWLPWLRGPAVLVGLFTVYLVSQSYRKRPTPYLLIGLVFVLALMTQVYQQTCLMNWSYMFEQWLLNQHVTPNQIGLYQLAYQIVYVLPLTVMLIVYVLISQTKRFTKIKEILDIMALLLITATALFLVLYPLALSNFILSLATIVPLVIFGWLWNTYK